MPEVTQELTPEEVAWNEWKQHPCTKRLMVWSKEQKQSLMEMWAAGNFSAAFSVEMAVKNAGGTGACSVYTSLIELDYNQIGVIDEEEQVGAVPSGASRPG